MLLIYNLISIEDEKQSTIERQEDFTKPTISEKQGLLYLQGLTLGDSQSKVIERLGVNYSKNDNVDGSSADYQFNYDGIASFYFYQGKLDSMIYLKVDENYFEKLFNDYEGFKFYTRDNDRYIYSQETGQLLKATIVPDGNLYLYLIDGGKDLLENPDFPEIIKVLD